MIRLFVEGQARPLPRPRHRMVPAAKDGTRPSFIMTYNPPGDWCEWKNLISARIRQAAAAAPARLLLKSEDPVRVELVFIMKDTAAAIDDVHHGIKPDLDNLIKLVMDAATEAKVFYDDSRVSMITARKRYPANKQEVPGVHIAIDRAPGQPDLLAAPASLSEAAASDQMDKH